MEAFRGWHSVKTGNGLGFVSPVGQSKVDLRSALLLVGLDTVCLGTPQAVCGESSPQGGAWREALPRRCVERGPPRRFMKRAEGPKSGPQEAVSGLGREGLMRQGDGPTGVTDETQLWA